MGCAVFPNSDAGTLGFGRQALLLLRDARNSPRTHTMKPTEYSRMKRIQTKMNDLLTILLIIGAWLALQYLILPKLGVPT